MCINHVNGVAQLYASEILNVFPSSMLSRHNYSINSVCVKHKIFKRQCFSELSKVHFPILSHVRSNVSGPASDSIS